MSAQIESVERGLELAHSQREAGLQAGGNAATGPAHGPHGGGGAVNVKNVGAMGATLKQLLGYAKNVRLIMAIALVLSIFAAVLTVIGPNYLGDIADEIGKGIMGGMDHDQIWHLARVSIAIMVGSLIFNYAQSLLMVRATQRTAQRMRTDLDRKIDRMPLAYFDRNTHGDILSRVTNDIDTLSQTLNNSVSTIISGIVTIIGSAVMMFWTEWRMALAGVAAALVGFMGSMVIMAISQKHFVAQQRQLGALNGHIEEVFSGHSVVKAYNAEAESREEFDRRNDALFHSAWKAQFLSGLMMPLMNFIGNLGYVVVCILGAALVIHGTVSVGVIVSFMIYIRLFTNPLGQIASAATSFQSAAAAGTRVFEFLEEDELEDESSKKQFSGQVRGTVEFKDVHFGYSADREIIHGFNATVEAGQKVAIVGPTGAGKTTMVNLLMRFYDVDSGQILIDGVPTTELRREDVDAMFSMVLQDTWMFEGTLRENIVYQAEGVSEARVAEVLDEVGLTSLVRQLPKGLDTVMSESVALSAGQKQLVTIARAMLADHPLLILDEATSSIDTRTEQLIQNALDSLTVGRTSFVIAHRLSTIRNADVIFVMKDGDIVETGNHDELIARGGFYCDLYNSQFEPEEIDE